MIDYNPLIIDCGIIPIQVPISRLDIHKALTLFANALHWTFQPGFIHHSQPAA